MAFRIVRPETDTLTLPDGDTLTVRRRLTTGEQRAVLKRSRIASTGVPELDQLEYAFQLVTAYLLDWTSPSGEAPIIRGVDEGTLISTLNALDPDDYVLVKNAIVMHVERLAQERADAKKKMLSGTSTSGPILPLPSDVTGQLTGSAI